MLKIDDDSEMDSFKQQYKNFGPGKSNPIKTKISKEKFIVHGILNGIYCYLI